MNAPLPPPRCSRVAPTAALALALFSAVLVCAQPDVLPAIPDAPTVPVAPMLPDAAMLKQPMPPQVSQKIIEERPSSQHVWIAGHWR